MRPGGVAALPPPARVGAGPMPPVMYDNVLYHVDSSVLSDFPPHAEITLHGTVTEHGGTVAVWANYFAYR